MNPGTALEAATFDDSIYVRDTAPFGATVHTYYRVKHRDYGQTGEFAQLTQQSITPAETGERPPVAEGPTAPA